jgi:hypothetical protein
MMKHDIPLYSVYNMNPVLHPFVVVELDRVQQLCQVVTTLICILRICIWYSPRSSGGSSDLGTSANADFDSFALRRRAWRLRRAAAVVLLMHSAKFFDNLQGVRSAHQLGQISDCSSMSVFGHQIDATQQQHLDNRCPCSI